MLVVLLIAALLTGIIAIATNTYSDLIDVVVIITIVLINAMIGFFQENSANNALESLKKLSQPTAKVMRDGKITTIKTNEVVVGDVLYSQRSPIQLHSSRSTRALLHFTVMTTSSSILIPCTISSLLVRPQGLITAG